MVRDYLMIIFLSKKKRHFFRSWLFENVRRALFAYQKHPRDMSFKFVITILLAKIWLL